MTSVVLAREGDAAFSFSARGHAGGGEAGRDIVCAAETALARTAAEVLSRTPGVSVRALEARGGALAFTAAAERGAGALTAERVRTAADFLAAGFASLSREFPALVSFREEAAAGDGGRQAFGNA